MNNRILKFRVWDKERKTFTYPEDKEHNYSEPTENGGLGYYLLTQSGILQCNDGNYIDDWRDGFIVQQFTGLKDKNDKDVYEGDILRILIDADRYVQVSVAWDNDCLMWTTTAKMAGRYELLGDLESTNIEIVGNIFEKSIDNA